MLACLYGGRSIRLDQDRVSKEKEYLKEEKVIMNTPYQLDAHIQFTHQIARHEYHHAVKAKNYLKAMEWSLLWFNTLNL